MRRVKCDETYPVCRRCDRRGTVCIPAPRKTIWKLEMPFLIRQATDATPSALLQYWFERVCHIMVLDPDVNPWALPLLTFVKESAALMHVVQSVAAAHKDGFHNNHVKECLIERRETISSIQQELSQSGKQPVSTFLAIFLLGISSPWIEGTSDVEHLMGARAVLDTILDDPANDLSDSTIQLMLGLYMWWEMASSFRVDHPLRKPLNTSTIHKAVYASRSEYHSLAGYSLELFYLLGNLNRYCRGIIDGESRDLVLEATLEEQLLNWEPKKDNEHQYLVGDAYRKHGLIFLGRVCGPKDDMTEQENEERIQQWAAEAIDNLQQIPLTSPSLNIQPIPLLSAASEIPSHKMDQREEVKKRFQAIYSINRLPVMLDAISLLEEVWELRPLGITTSWLVIVHERAQLFPLA
jgi:hypothetical protein